MPTLFLLSPARCGGPRATQLAASKTATLGATLRDGQAPLGDVFAWLSALYFRGKLVYSRAFAAPSPGLPGALVMAPGRGLLPPETMISAQDLKAMGKVEVESAAFTKPLRRDAEAAARDHAASTQVVLLGSIATGKYVDTLIEIFGGRLVFPVEFVGRGDMSRGGMMLRAAREERELAYAMVAGAQRTGTRAAKLPKLAKRVAS